MARAGPSTVRDAREGVPGHPHHRGRSTKERAPANEPIAVRDTFSRYDGTRVMPILYAHRGASRELPENTLPAFARALELGADAIETDAHLTRDGAVVLSHDPTGRRMAGVGTAIAAATLAEVQSWDASARFVTAGGGEDIGRGTAGPWRMPTLEEALLAFPGVRFNVDAKSRHPSMVERIIEVVRRAGAEERTLLASFDVATLRAVRRAGYRGETGLAREEVVRLLAFPGRVLKWLPLRGVAAQLPHRIYGMNLGTKAVVEKCHAAGLRVHYWTVNDPALAEALLDAGADGIMTDDPRSIAPVMTAWRARARDPM